jgi:xylem cysteine proteinase
MLLLILCAVAFGNDVEKLFSDWSKEHGKVYGSTEETFRRYDIFKTNVEWINKRNQELKYMTVGLNEFADMTLEEFEGYYLDNSYVHNETEYAAELKALGAVPQDNNNIPRGGTCTTPVRNQGKCGSCWAFAAGASLEALVCIPGEGENAYGWVSTQELVDCSCHGCNGGLAKTGLSYYQSKGYCYEGEYTYTAKDGTCQSSKCSHKGIGGLSTAKDEDGSILKGLASNFMAISIDAGGLNFMFYKSGTYGLDSEDNSNKVDCNKRKVNHAVTAVAAALGADGLPNGNYHVKNSWGASWGNAGYFDMPAGVNCLGVQKRQGIYPHA